MYVVGQLKTNCTGSLLEQCTVNDEAVELVKIYKSPIIVIVVPKTLFLHHISE